MMFKDELIVLTEVRKLLRIVVRDRYLFLESAPEMFHQIWPFDK